MSKRRKRPSRRPSTQRRTQVPTTIAVVMPCEDCGELMFGSPAHLRGGLVTIDGHPEMPPVPLVTERDGSTQVRGFVIGCNVCRKGFEFISGDVAEMPVVDVVPDPNRPGEVVTYVTYQDPEEGSLGN